MYSTYYIIDHSENLEQYNRYVTSQVITISYRILFMKKARYHPLFYAKPLSVNVCQVRVD